MKRNDESFSVKGTRCVNYMINKLIVAVVAAVVSTAASVNGYVYAESNQYDEYTDGVYAKDASTILVAYAKASTGSEEGLTEQQAADVNADGKVDAKDASAILAYYAMASTASGDVPSLKEYMTGKTS